MPCVRLGGHLRIEEAIAVASFRLGPIKRQVGLLHQLAGLDPVQWRERYANAGLDIDPVAVDVIGLGDDCQDAVGEGARVVALAGLAGLQDGELVATETRQDVGLAQRRPQPPRGLLEQGIAFRVPERIVDVLEPVEIEHEDGESLAAPAQAGARFLDLLHEQRAIGQAGQQVVVRHVFDALVGARAIGHVLDDAEQVFRLAVLAAHRDPARRHQARAVARGLDLMRSVVHLARMLQQVEVAGEDHVGGLLRKQVVGGLADHLVAGHSPQLLEGAIDQDVALSLHLLGEHRDRRVLDDRVEKDLGALELGPGLQPRGDVLVGGNPSAVRHSLRYDADRTPIAGQHRAAVGGFFGKSLAKRATIIINVAWK